MGISQTRLSGCSFISAAVWMFCLAYSSHGLILSYGSFLARRLTSCVFFNWKLPYVVYLSCKHVPDYLFLSLCIISIWQANILDDSNTFTQSFFWLLTLWSLLLGWLVSCSDLCSLGCIVVLSVLLHFGSSHLKVKCVFCCCGDDNKKSTGKS